MKSVNSSIYNENDGFVIGDFRVASIFIGLYSLWLEPIIKRRLNTIENRMGATEAAP